MTIEIVDFPINSMVIFHCYVAVYQRVYSHRVTHKHSNFARLQRSHCWNHFSISSQIIWSKLERHAVLSCQMVGCREFGTGKWCPTYSKSYHNWYQLVERVWISQDFGAQNLQRRHARRSHHAIHGTGWKLFIAVRVRWCRAKGRPLNSIIHQLEKPKSVDAWGHQGWHISCYYICYYNIDVSCFILCCLVGCNSSCYFDTKKPASKTNPCQIHSKIQQQRSFAWQGPCGHE